MSFSPFILFLLCLARYHSCFIVLPTTTNDPKVRQFDKNFYFDPELSSFVFDLYNFYRRQAFHGLIDNQPQAKLMPYVFWDEGLAFRAKEWSKKCQNRLDDSPLALVFGQSNAAASYSKPLGGNMQIKQIISKVFLNWFDEHVFYNFTANKCEQNETCDNYKQMVAWRTTSIGCGLTQCHNFLQNVTIVDDVSNSTTTAASTATTTPSSTSTPASTATTILAAGGGNVTDFSLTANETTIATTTPASVETTTTPANIYAYSFVCFHYPKAPLANEKPYDALPWF